MIGFGQLLLFMLGLEPITKFMVPCRNGCKPPPLFFSMWLFIPVWTVVYNLFATLQQDWAKYLESAPVRF